jgi:hypothetical protein
MTQRPTECFPAILRYRIGVALDNPAILLLRLWTTSGELALTLHQQDLVSIGAHFMQFTPTAGNTIEGALLN